MNRKTLKPYSPKPETLNSRPQTLFNSESGVPADERMRNFAAHDGASSSTKSWQELKAQGSDGLGFSGLAHAFFERLFLSA